MVPKYFQVQVAAKCAWTRSLRCLTSSDSCKAYYYEQTSAGVSKPQMKHIAHVPEHVDDTGAQDTLKM
jgi:hypothetical protein